MKTIVASVFAVSIMLSSGAYASEAHHNGTLVREVSSQTSILSGFQALDRAGFSRNTVAVAQAATDPARSANSGK